MTVVSILLAATWLAMLVMAVIIWVMLRQIGVLYERVAPVGAMMDGAGPQVGAVSPIFELASLNGGRVIVGPTSARAQLIFFLSPTCPVCKQLLPALTALARAEKAWVDVVLASDGAERKHREFIAKYRLNDFVYVLSADLGMSYRVQRLPFAVLLDAAGVIQSKGLINSREHLESLFNALETGVPSAQQALALQRAS